MSSRRQPPPSVPVANRRIRGSVGPRFTQQAPVATYGEERAYYNSEAISALQRPGAAREPYAMAPSSLGDGGWYPGQTGVNYGGPYDANVSMRPHSPPPPATTPSLLSVQPFRSSPLPFHRHSETTSYDAEAPGRSTQVRQELAVPNYASSELGAAYNDEEASIIGSLESVGTREPSERGYSETFSTERHAHGTRSSSSHHDRVSVTSSSGTSTSTNTRNLLSAGYTTAVANRERRQRIYRQRSCEDRFPDSAAHTVSDVLQGGQGLTVPCGVDEPSGSSGRGLRHTRSAQAILDPASQDRRLEEAAVGGVLQNMLDVGTTLNSVTKFFSFSKKDSTKSNAQASEGEGSSAGWKAYLLDSRREVLVCRDGIKTFIPSGQQAPGPTRQIVPLGEFGPAVVALGEKSRGGGLRYIGTYRVEDGSQVEQVQADMFNSVLSCLLHNTAGREFASGAAAPAPAVDRDALKRNLGGSSQVM